MIHAISMHYKLFEIEETYDLDSPTYHQTQTNPSVPNQRSKFSPQLFSGYSIFNILDKGKALFITIVTAESG